MSRRTAIIVIASVAIAIGLGVLSKAIFFVEIDPDSRPGCSLQYIDQDNNDAEVGLNLSGYHWMVEADPEAGTEVWTTAGPNNFFTEKYALKEITPGDLELHIELVWNIPPDQITIMRWPISEWTPGDFEINHSQGEGVTLDWVTKWKKTDIGFDAERGSLYGVWVYYGDAWVEYSFLVPAEDSIDYDYLGYISGFDDPDQTQFSVDRIEWIDMSNAQRIAELNLNVDDDFPSGFFIYDPTHESTVLRLTDQTKYSIINLDTGNTQKTVDKSEFFDHLNQSTSFSEITPFWISETDGNVEFITEQYLP